MDQVFFVDCKHTRLIIVDQKTDTTSFNELWTTEYLYRYLQELVFTRLSVAINNRNVFSFIFQVGGK